MQAVAVVLLPAAPQLVVQVEPVAGVPVQHTEAHQFRVHQIPVVVVVAIGIILALEMAAVV
jgi:methyl coenzyme M reductase subunit D